MNTVTLLHGTFRPKRKVVYFYNGLEVARDGLLTLPLTKKTWIERAWRTGYNLSPDGRRLWTMQDLKKEIDKQTAESAKEQDEDSDSGRQPTPEDRVRAS